MFYHPPAPANQAALLSFDHQLSSQRFHEKSALTFSPDQDDFEFLQLRKAEQGMHLTSIDAHVVQC